MRHLCIVKGSLYETVLAPELEDKRSHTPALLSEHYKEGHTTRQEYFYEATLAFELKDKEQNGKGKAERTHAEAVNASEEAPVSVPPCNDSEKSEAKLVTELNVDYSDIGDENNLFQNPFGIDDNCGEVETEPIVKIWSSRRMTGFGACE
ncbi:uncharacterized protein NFIA_026780 [Aspergillus fischeri NRRL 181]|uniref:Uncharacterized protein n=1 Tax=Neosartorya fischeri (strain ATCC 1020 / DSM 3700 / CBS 544.65 / FGSC A1164 / JCM 1740 / NRRL 181 / WB 181) TaxID=331117 RepID=A1DCP4_NEOFI|nr:uncharacterized protein NFIA_026780 [Aspergillus fischeri NRRL 181]EAW19604.1 hypothetical protein NFIA_026780 [Aspergillus fischeri NRRL 181]